MKKLSRRSAAAATKNRLKIGLVFDDSLDSYDGVAQYVKTVGGWMARQGHDVSYLVGKTKIKEFENGKVHSLAKNMPVAFNANRLSIPLPANRKKIKNLLSEYDFDVLHVQMPHSPSMAGVVVKYARARTALVGTFHIMPAGSSARLGSRLLKLAYGTSLSRFDEIVSVSPAAAGFARDAFKINSEIIPNAVDLSKLSAGRSLKPKTKARRIIFLGRLVKRKGCQHLLKAFELLLPKLPEAKLIIAGDGPLRRQLESYVRRHKLTSSVSFLGFVNEARKPELLRNADVACFPSTAGESFGIVLLEAIAAGNSVVLGGDNPGYHSVLGPKPDLLINPSNAPAFARRLHHLLSNTAARKELLDWQAKRVKRYDIEIVGPQLLRLYARAIAKRSANKHNKT